MLSQWNSFFIFLIYTVILCGIIHFVVNPIQPTAYMDEIFHEEQTLAYIRGEWLKWDPKITTPPGLYVLTAFVWRIFSFPPSVKYFRFVNCFISGANFLVLTELTGSIRVALSISTLPVLFFSALLFYTDQLSLFILLLTFLAQRSSFNFLAFMLGCFACFVRQTNVVWIVFIIGEYVVRRLVFTQFCVSNSLLQYLTCLLKHPISTCFAIFKAALLDVPHHTATVVFFIAWVIYFNHGDIVLGDRSAHQPVLHIPQLFYFFVFCAFHTPIAFLRYLSANLRLPSRQSLLGLATLLVFVLLSIHFYTFEHPYLLADNRHYTFYIWSRFFRRFKSFRYTLAPLYIICGDYIWTGLSGLTMPQNLIALGYLASTSLAIIPAGLIELRYFITPYVIWRLKKPPGPDDRLPSLLETTMNILINAVTIYVFIFYPFRWISQPFTWQRFMW